MVKAFILIFGLVAATVGQIANDLPVRNTQITSRDSDQLLNRGFPAMRDVKQFAGATADVQINA
jgi:hypothetical protein